MATDWTETQCRGTCGKMLQYHGRGRPRHFCADCYHEARKLRIADAVAKFTGVLPVDVRNHERSARKFLSTHGYTLRGFLESATPSLISAHYELSPSGGGRNEYLYKRYLAIRKALTAGDHDSITDASRALQEYMIKENVLDTRIWLGCDELIRDAGVRLTPGMPLHLAFRVLDQQCEAIIRGWVGTRDYLQAAVAILTRANLHRSNMDVPGLGRVEVATGFVRATEHILRGMCRKVDPRARNLLLHHAVLWRCRLRIVHAREVENAGTDIAELHDLAGSVGSPQAWLETWRDTCTFYAHRRDRGDLDKARAALEDANQLFSDLPVKSPWTELGLLRARIRLLEAGGGTRIEKDRAINQYAALCRKYPSTYQLRIIEELGHSRNESPQSPRTIAYLGAMLPFTYTEPALQRI